MTVDEIRALGPDLADYLDEFAECFPRRASRFHLQEYVRGQLSHLPRLENVPSPFSRALRGSARPRVQPHDSRRGLSSVAAPRLAETAA